MKNVVVLAEAANDIECGIDFYNSIEDGVGLYDRDALIADIRRFGVYFGEHRIHLGFFRSLASRFPYAIYHRDMEGTRQVVAVFDLRRSAGWIRDQLTARLKC